ncbi:MAG: helix-turn-helix domain-containing protein [Mycobacteriales bacterium]
MSGPAAVGPDVLASWARSAEWVDPDCRAAPVDDPELVLQAWSESPAVSGLGAAEAEVRQVVEDGELVAAVTDAAGRIVWTAGSRVMRRAAERVNFIPGGRWDEASVGTNALALALRNARPSTVYSAEHFSRAVHGWVCYAVPLTDPATGEVLGVLDLSTTWDRAHPLVMAAARSLGRAVTAGLVRSPAPPLTVRILGEPRAQLPSGEVPLSPRQAEILALLALHPDGLTLERLHDRLYGDLPVTLSTLKAEVSHLRTLLGGALGSRPYRLTSAVRTDVHRLLAALDRGDLAGAVAAYGGSLLPLSESPGVREWRDYVDVALRNAVLTSVEVASVLAFAERHPYDADVQQHLVDVLPAVDPRRPRALARVARATNWHDAG